MNAHSQFGEYVWFGHSFFFEELPFFVYVSLCMPQPLCEALFQIPISHETQLIVSGDRTFSVAVFTLWNDLLSKAHQAPLQYDFRRLIKM